MLAIQINSNIEKEENDVDKLLDSSGNEFVFYKIIRLKSCNKQTQLLAYWFLYIR